MKKIFLLWSALTAANSLNAELLEFRSEDFNPASLKDASWQITLGLEHLWYPTTLPAFEGTHLQVEDEETIGLYGMSLGFGGERRLFADLSATLRLSGFFAQSLKETLGKAGKGLDVELSRSRNDQSVYGGEAVMALNYLFENRILNIQPFVEFGVGAGASKSAREYVFSGIMPDGSDAERYDIRVDEEFAYAKAAIGVNFISKQGIASYIKVSQMALDVSERETAGRIGSTELDLVEEEVDSKDMLAAGIGMAYRF